MLAVRSLVFLASLIFAASAAAQPAEQRRPAIHDDASLDHLVWDRLSKFRSERDFLNYLRAARTAARARGYWWAYGPGVQYAQAEQIPCPEGEECPEETAEDVVVTGSRASAPAARSVSAQANVASAPGSITNTQKIGVDEGDIVKQYGRFLIVLQDGRLFTIDTRPSNAPGLALVDRENVYRDEEADTWYDEMLVYRNRIVVTGYSYGENATEFSVFTISEAGALAHEATYFLSSSDYYDVENYASRLVDDRLIIYSPLPLRSVNPDRPLRWPLVRRWRRAESGGATGEKPLFDAHNIHRPVQRTLRPVIHTISVCPLGAAASGDELDCSATAFVGPEDYEYYVSRTHAYLWVSSADDEREASTAAACADLQHFERGAPAALFQIPLSGRAPRAMFVRGEPKDQFSLETSDTEFRALLMWGDPAQSSDCKRGDNTAVRYFSAPLRAFRSIPATASRERYVVAPSPGADEFENRFTDHYVVYGGRSTWGSHPPWEEAGPQSARVVALPVARPREASTLETPHNVIRIERAGDDIVLTGYRDRAGLSVSLVDLDGAPRLASTEILERRYESEGRSHAFNSLIGADGAGLMGIPTVLRTQEARRWWWWSGESDVSFLSVDASGRLRSIGPLTTGGKKATHPDYRCEASCVDWYGNARPIFTDGRIFALTGVEMIEGAVADGRMTEIRRVNLSTPLRDDAKAPMAE